MINPDDRNARYFATSNIISPFVMVFGSWPDRSSLVRSSLINGVKLGVRPMLDIEIAEYNKSTRHMFMYFKTIRDMLWLHKSPDLIHFYPILLDNIRIKRNFIKAKHIIIKKKRAIKEAQKIETAEIVEQNKIIQIGRAITKVDDSNDDFKDLIKTINHYKYEFEYKLANEL